MKFKELSLYQSYIYKGWQVYINGELHWIRPIYTFHVRTFWALDVLDSISTSMAQGTNIPHEIIRIALMKMQPPKFFYYDITIKQKWGLSLLSNTPYVREAIQQVNSNIDNYLGDVVTYIKQHMDELNQNIQSLITQNYSK